MEISFRGDSILDILSQAQEFVKFFENKKKVDTFPEVEQGFHMQNLETVKQTNGAHPPIYDEISELKPIQPEIIEKKKAGRPVESLDKKQAKLEKIKSEIQASNGKDVVGATGFEPALSSKEPVVPANEPVVLSSEDEKKTTKQDLAALLQKVCEKENSYTGNKDAGVNRVREIFEQFGIKRLGELAETRYPELQSHIMECLA